MRGWVQQLSNTLLDNCHGVTTLTLLAKLKQLGP